MNTQLELVDRKPAPASRIFLFALVALIATMIAPKSTFAIERDDLFLMQTAHNFEQQRELGFRPRRDVEPWPLELPLNWAADPFEDRNWRFQLNAWRMIDPYIVAYFKSGDVQLLAEALEYVEDWHAFHADDDHGNSFAWYDMSTGIRALRIAFFLDLIEKSELAVTPQQRQALDELAGEHAERLQDLNFLTTGNHGLFQVFGLNLLCLVASDVEECEGGRELAATYLKDEILPAQFTPQGVHKENSPTYHYFTIRSIERLGGTRHIDVPEIREILDRAAAITPWFSFPSGNVARIGDSEGRLETLAEDPAEPECLTDDACYAVGDFTDSGYAIVRSLPSGDPQSMIFMAGMGFSTSHKHADDLSFELFEFGQLIFADSGKYGYNEDAMRSYVVSAAAHNTISIDGVETRPKDVDLTGSQLDPIEMTDDGFVLAGRINRPSNFSQDRTITYWPGRHLKIRDELASFPWRRQFVSSLHLAPDLEPELTENGFTIAIGENRVEAVLVEDDCRIETVRGQEEPLLGWFSESYLKMTPTSVVRAICPGWRRSISWEIGFE